MRLIIAVSLDVFRREFHRALQSVLRQHDGERVSSYCCDDPLALSLLLLHVLKEQIDSVVARGS